MSGYRRQDMGGWHLRVVTDRTAAYAYLRVAWPELPSSFFRWLRAGGPGETYRLARCVTEPELWVIEPPMAIVTSEPVRVPVAVR